MTANLHVHLYRWQGEKYTTKAKVYQQNFVLASQSNYKLKAGIAQYTQYILVVFAHLVYFISY